MPTDQYSEDLELGNDEWEDIDQGSSKLIEPKAHRDPGPNGSTQSRGNSFFLVGLVVLLFTLSGVLVGGYFLWVNYLSGWFFPAAKPVAVQTSTVETPTKPAVPEKRLPSGPKILGVHPVVSGDTLWWISDKWYKEALLWPLVYRFNQAKIQDPDLLFPGMALDIPALFGSTEQLSSEDKKNLGEGYLSAYRVYREKGKVDAEDYRKAADRYQSP